MRLPAGGLRPGLENAWGRRASYAGLKTAAQEPRHGRERHHGRAGKDDGWETPFPPPGASPQRTRKGARACRAPSRARVASAAGERASEST